MTLNALLLAVLLGSVLATLYPFTLYPVILWLFPARPLDLQASVAPPSLSLLFCAYNEARALPAKIDNLRTLKAAYPDLEILAYDDGSSDGTLDLLRGAGPLLRVITGAGRQGKAHGMKMLAAEAQGEVLIFTDANVLLDVAAPRCLAARYADPHVGGVLGALHYVTERRAGATARTGGTYWRLEEWLKALESRTGNVMGADGSIFSVRRSLYPDFPDTVLDDFTVSMFVIFQGYRLIKVDDAIAHENLVSDRMDEYRRKKRIAARSWHTRAWLSHRLRAMGPLDRFKYGSHKMLRWMGGAFLLLGMTSAVVLAFRITPEVGFGLLACGGLVLATGQARRGPAASLLDIFLAYLATLHGIILALGGRTMATWSPAASRDKPEETRA